MQPITLKWAETDFKIDRILANHSTFDVLGGARRRHYVTNDQPDTETNYPNHQADIKIYICRSPNFRQFSFEDQYFHIKYRKQLMVWVMLLSADYYYVGTEILRKKGEGRHLEQKYSR